MKGLILFCALFACFLFTAPARAECAGGFCGLSGRPVLRAVAAPVRAVQFVRQNKPVRSFFANRQPVRRALRGVGSLFVR
jgi:hypothetical protein